MQLKTHVQGVINHGQEKFYTFADINEYCHDSNMVMNVLLKVIYDSIDKVCIKRYITLIFLYG